MRTIAPIIAALITGTVALTVGVLAYVFGRLQKEYEVRFTRLHERQAEVVAELYQLHHQTLADYRRWDRHNELGDYRSRNIAHRSAGKKLNRFSVLYEEQDILISPWLWLRLHNFYRGARKALSDSAMFNVERKAPTGKGIHTFLRTSEFSNLAEELKAEYEEVLGISGSRSRTGRGVLLPPMLRLVGGLVGAALIGLGVSGIICVAAGIGDPIIL